jgi:hypothetical protein
MALQGKFLDTLYQRLMIHRCRKENEEHRLLRNQGFARTLVYSILHDLLEEIEGEPNLEATKGNSTKKLGPSTVKTLLSFDIKHDKASKETCLEFNKIMYYINK